MPRRTFVSRLVAALALAVGGPEAGRAQPTAGEAGGAAPRARDLRAVVVLRPGPAWRAGLALTAQAGYHAHVDHYRALRRDGKLAHGGAFLDAAGGGLMIAAPGVTEAEMRTFAAADPAVRSGLLAFEVRPWLVTMAP